MFYTSYEKDRQFFLLQFTFRKKHLKLKFYKNCTYEYIFDSECRKESISYTVIYF